jgi:hypothetical protein
MANAKVVKSKRGNDLIVATFGPKEAATILAADLKGPYADGIYDALTDAQSSTKNRKYLDYTEKVEFLKF